MSGTGENNGHEARTSFRRALIWPVLVAGAIFLASSRSVVAEPHIGNGDKVAHFAVYGLLGTLLCRLGLGRRWRGALVALLLASAFGASDEWHQSFVPGRDCDVWDWAADTAGAAIAVTAYVGWAKYRGRLEREVAVSHRKPDGRGNSADVKR